MHYKWIAEFRYLPVPRILDTIGRFAEVLTSDLLDIWEVTNGDRADVSNAKRTKGLFVSVRNFGFATEGESDFGAFEDKIREVLNILPQPPKYTRWGLRMTAIHPSADNFEILTKRIQDKLLRVDMLDSSSFKWSMEDLAVVYEFKVKGDSVHLQLGPMKKAQSSGFFVETEKIPENGLFIDLDYYRSPDRRPARYKEVVAFIAEAKQNIEALSEVFSGLATGEAHGSKPGKK